MTQNPFYEHIYSNHNLLDNSDFRNPVNQRGQESYSGAMYSIDRWRSSKSLTVSLQKGYIDVSSAGTSGITFFQYVSPENVPYGQHVTASMLTKDNVLITCEGDVPVSVGNANINIGSTAGDIRFNIALQSSGMIFFGIIVGNGTNVSLVACKLELGSAQTLAHKEGDTWVLNDPPPNYQQELAKCQRYQIILQNLPNGTTNYARFGIGIAGTATQAIIFCALPIQLAKSPSVNYTGDLCLFNGTGTPINVTSISFDRISTNGIAIKANVANGLTEKSPYLLIAGSVGSAQVIFDANL